MEMCTPAEDREFGAIVLWLLMTEQEAHTNRHGATWTAPGRHTELRRRRRQPGAAEALAAAEAKRLRKMQKRTRL